MNQGTLDKLGEKLGVVDDIVASENNRIKSEKDSLSRLWTALGRNNAKLREFDSHDNLLQDVRTYREDASRQVASTLFQLERMLSDLEQLNIQVSTPALVGDADIPIEVHIAAMRKGTDRLMEGTKRAREREDAYLRKMIANDSA